jgi:tetratricopeptide (TPR) repeat protein
VPEPALSVVQATRSPAVWGGSVPQRNKNFTGREDLLRELHSRVTGEITAVLPHTLGGMGGVGKTQLAIEYAYRYGGEYQLVWWISADQPELARAALAGLAPRLNITGIPQHRLEDMVEAVRDALRRGEPYARWLLVFDNADQPESIRGLMPPPGPGHVLVTSRNQQWNSIADTVEVNVFSRKESLEFLSRRVPEISLVDADLLAERLGDLPIALEQAGALQVEGGMAAMEYLELMDKEASELLGENRPADYPVSVAAAWSLSMSRVQEQLPDALELLRRCAFLGPEPIPVAWLKQGKYVLGPPMNSILGEPQQRTRAIRELGRYSLIRVDNRRNTLQVHRLIQRLIQDDLAPEDRDRIRHEVHLLLAAADPDDPDDPSNWPTYQELLAHVGPANVIHSTNPDVRRLTRNLARYLYVFGDYTASRQYAQRALAQWTADSGADDRDVLDISKTAGDAQWQLGDYQPAYELRSAAVARSRRVLGEDDEVTLALVNALASDLRVRGDFAGARALDEESVPRHRRIFGESHPRTFTATNNLALDHALTSDYQRARELDEQNFQNRRDFFGSDDHPEPLQSRTAFARDLRQSGDYPAARELGEQIHLIYQDLIRQRTLPENHGVILLQARELAVARRKVGDFVQALDLARDVFSRYRQIYGEDHADTLAAATTVGNTQHLAGEFAQAAELIRDAANRYQKVLGSDHPYTHGCALNLGIVRRQQGEADAARGLCQGALTALEAQLGPDHHFTLLAAAGLASALAALGETEEAARLDAQTAERLARVLGENHPHTLAVRANRALGIRALGREQEAAELLGDIAAQMRRSFGKTYPDIPSVEAGERLEIDFEPSPL